MPVLIADPNRGHLRAARQAGLNTFYGDVLSEAAEHNLELTQYGRIIALSDNDAYNTLITTDLGPEFGRDNVFQIAREKDGNSRHALPSTLGGRSFAQGLTYDALEAKVRAGQEMRLTRLSAEYPVEQWQQDAPEAQLLLAIDPKGSPRLPRVDKPLPLAAEWQLIWLGAKEAK